MVPNDIVSSLIAVQMGGTGGGGVTSDILDVFEQQTPIIDIPLFGDYRFSLVKLPEGYYYPIQRIYEETTRGSEKVFYESMRYYNSSWIRGYWQNKTLLYVDWVNWNTGDYSIYSWSLDANNTPYLSQKDIYSFPDIAVTYMGATSTGQFNINFAFEYIQSRTIYNSDGEITNKYSRKITSNLSWSFDARNWYYTRFKGEELMNKMDEVAHDIYAEYLKNQG